MWVKAQYLSEWPWCHDIPWISLSCVVCFELWLTHVILSKIDEVSAGDSEVLWKSCRRVDASRKPLTQKEVKHGLCFGLELNTPSYVHRMNVPRIIRERVLRCMALTL